MASDHSVAKTFCTPGKPEGQHASKTTSTKPFKRSVRLMRVQREGRERGTQRERQHTHTEHTHTHRQRERESAHTNTHKQTQAQAVALSKALTLGHALSAGSVCVACKVPHSMVDNVSRCCLAQHPRAPHRVHKRRQLLC